MLNRIAVFLLGFCALGAAASDWAQFRGPNRDGLNTETNWTTAWPKEGPKKIWSAQLGTGFASVSISGGKLFSIGNINNEDVVWCLDANTGALVWKFAYACQLNPKYYPGGPSATPTVENGRVYTLSKAGNVYCFNAADGAVIWKKELIADAGVKAPDWGFASSARIEGDALYFNAGLSGVALNKNSGDVIWKSGPGPGAYASVVPITVGAEKQLAVLSKDTLFGVLAADGVVRWSFKWPTSFGENTPDPVPVPPDMLLVTSGHGLGSALLKLKGDSVDVVWKNEKYGNHLASSVLLDGNLYGMSGLIHKPPVGGLACVDVKTGETKWMEAGLRGSLLVSNKTLLALTIDGLLIAAEATPEKYKEIGRVQILGGKCWTAPVLCNGKLYARNANGELGCFDMTGN